MLVWLEFPRRCERRPYTGEPHRAIVNRQSRWRFPAREPYITQTWPHAVPLVACVLPEPISHGADAAKVATARAVDHHVPTVHQCFAYEVEHAGYRIVWDIARTLPAAHVAVNDAIEVQAQDRFLNVLPPTSAAAKDHDTGLLHAALIGEERSARGERPNFGGLTPKVAILGTPVMPSSREVISVQLCIAQRRTVRARQI